MANIKHALLDTDFISKMHLIRKDEQNKLINEIMAMPNYIFYCHDQIKIEISRHNIAGSREWLEEKISDGSIRLYDDEKIMEELYGVYYESAPAMYVHMLKTACEAYKNGYFDEHFVEISKLDYRNLRKEEFLDKLKVDCNNISEGQNLGEIKTYVLLQVLIVKLGTQIYVFCSDDRNARKGIISIGEIRCISVLSSFLRLQKESGFTREEAEPYFESYMNCCLGSEQTTFRIIDKSKERRFCRIPCRQVFNDMFSGKLEEEKTGFLKLI